MKLFFMYNKFRNFRDVVVSPKVIYSYIFINFFQSVPLNMDTTMKLFFVLV